MGRKVITWRGMVVISAVFLLAFGCVMYGSLSSRSAMEAQYAKQQETIVQMQQEVSELKSELARVGTDGYVENEARERYDYIMDGEMRFEFSDPDKLENYTEEEWQIIMDEKLYPAY